jgi:hypothetical protein
MLRVLFGVALVLRLLVDMATPFMPGAFHVDPAEAVEAHRTQSLRSADHAVARPTALPPRRAAEVVKPDTDGRIRPAPDVSSSWSPRLRPLLARHTLEARSRAAEDH